MRDKKSNTTPSFTIMYFVLILLCMVLITSHATSGLYAKYKEDGAAFVDTYKAMLKATSVTDVEECARIAGVDLTDKNFWRQGLQSIANRIDEFCELVG